MYRLDDQSDIRVGDVLEWNETGGRWEVDSLDPPMVKCIVAPLRTTYVVGRIYAAYPFNNQSGWLWVEDLFTRWARTVRREAGVYDNA